MKNLPFLALVLIGFLVSSCSKNLTYFTEDLYNDNSWSEDDLKQIQFYLSQDIFLKKVQTLGESDIENGQIKIKRQKSYEEVIIKKGTPGLLVFSPKEDRFALSFDDNSDKYLMFGPNEKAKGRYILLAKKWMKNVGIISYGGEEYKTTSDSAYAALMVDISEARKISKASNVASGRKIGG